MSVSGHEKNAEKNVTEATDFFSYILLKLLLRRGCCVNNSQKKKLVKSEYLENLGVRRRLQQP